MGIKKKFEKLEERIKELEEQLEEKYKEGRSNGIALCTDIVKGCKTVDEAVEKLRNEYRIREKYQIDTNLSLEELYNASDSMRRFINEAQILLWISTLADEFGFGEKRLNRAMDRFILKHTCINEGYAKWMDYVDLMEEKLKKKLKFVMVTQELRENGKI